MVHPKSQEKDLPKQPSVDQMILWPVWLVPLRRNYGSSRSLPFSFVQMHKLQASNAVKVYSLHKCMLLHSFTALSAFKGPLGAQIDRCLFKGSVHAEALFSFGGPEISGWLSARNYVVIHHSAGSQRFMFA